MLPAYWRKLLEDYGLIPVALTRFDSLGKGTGTQLFRSRFIANSSPLALMSEHVILGEEGQQMESVRKVWRWLMSETDPETKGQKGAVPAEIGPLAYRLVVIAVLCVTFMFIVVMVVFGLLRLFAEATQVVAALSSAFAVIGTLVGAYFGIKSSSEARNTIETVHRETVEPMQQVVQEATTAARQAASAADATHQAAQQAASAANATQQAAGAAEKAAGAAEKVATRQ
jgi:hypothetical protein